MNFSLSSWAELEFSYVWFWCAGPKSGLRQKPQFMHVISSSDVFAQPPLSSSSPSPESQSMTSLQFIGRIPYQTINKKFNSWNDKGDEAIIELITAEAPSSIFFRSSFTLHHSDRTRKHQCSLDSNIAISFFHIVFVLSFRSIP
jgi:hypothetical protein